MEDKKDLQVNKAAIKMIHADGFFKAGECEAMADVVRGLQYVEKDYGKEIENFSIVLPGIDPVFSKMLGEEIEVDRKCSGIFRKPIDNVVHFEHFDSLNEWCFVVALEKNVLNFFHHLKPGGKYGEVDAKTAIDGYQFNYRNLFEWDIHTNILLEPNQGVFFRPWMFHSMQDGIVQYYRLLSKGPLA